MKFDRKNYDNYKLDICPDCGRDLEGCFCDECEVKWEFVNQDGGEK